MAKETSTVDTVVNLCKRRGFVFPSGEIYGGTRSAWDYGPLGVELKENIRRQWWKSMVIARDDVVGLDSSIILPRETWVASGHVGTFTDPLTECLSCHKRFRVDHMQEALAAKKGIEDPDSIELTELACPNCGTRGQWTEAREFNMMLKTHVGVIEEESGLHYLRPETAQGIFVNFLNVMTSARKKPPFGIAQTGKSFRNEITPGNFIFRTREFEQMEMQFFVEPGTDMEWFEYWKAERMKWHQSLGLASDRLHYHEHEGNELAHYARAAFDIEFDFGGTLGFQEVEGIHNRGDFDLGRHQEYSGRKLEYFDQPKNKRYLPYVIETSVGADRTTLAALVNAYREEEVPGEDEGRTVLALHPSLAPVKAAVFALTKKDGMPEMARAIASELRQHVPVDYDETGSIGKRYRRQDEVGTPFCITVDGESVQDGTVTVRDRDTLKQDRIAAASLRGYLAERLGG
jgi:glycyl-tRNA synthetase